MFKEFSKWDMIFLFWSQACWALWDYGLPYTLFFSFNYRFKHSWGREDSLHLAPWEYGPAFPNYPQLLQTAAATAQLHRCQETERTVALEFQYTYSWSSSDKEQPKRSMTASRAMSAKTGRHPWGSNLWVGVHCQLCSCTGSWQGDPPRARVEPYRMPSWTWSRSWSSMTSTFTCLELPPPPSFLTIPLGPHPRQYTCTSHFPPRHSVLLAAYPRQRSLRPVERGWSTCAGKKICKDLGN